MAAKKKQVNATLAKALVDGLGFKPGTVKNQVSFIWRDAKGVVVEVIANTQGARINVRDALSATAMKKLGVQPAPAREIKGKPAGRGRWADGVIVDEAMQAKGRKLIEAVVKGAQSDA